MSSKQIAISAKQVNKAYAIYEKPAHRLWQALWWKKQFYSEFWALRDISFELMKGETIGIIGRNGSGKSTLLQLICGVLSVTSGEIQVQGRVAALLELGAGFNPEFSGKENVYMNAAILGLSQQEIASQYANIQAFADIGQFIDQPVKHYSSGMYVRLAFAIAVHTAPDILIIDEALAVGDVKFQAKCFNKLRELKESGVTILFVSHDVHMVRMLCERVFWLDQGQLVASGDPLEVTSQYIEYMFSDQTVPASVSLPEQVVFENTVFDPIARWGSQVGLIRYCAMYDQNKKITNVMMLGEKIYIKIVFYMPKMIDLVYFSVACCLKNTVGMDLIVSTTYDNQFVFDKTNALVEVEFEFNNYLKSGDYVLAIALEDRSGSLPTYFDFIDGAQYVTSIVDKPLFGIFHLPFSQRVNYLGEGSE